MEKRVSAQELQERGEVRPQVAVFSHYMAKRLLANAHKRHWSGAPDAFLLNRAQDEVLELRIATEKGDAGDVLHEAADVANFALMVADNALPHGLLGAALPVATPRGRVPEGVAARWLECAACGDRFAAGVPAENAARVAPKTTIHCPLCGCPQRVPGRSP